MAFLAPMMLWGVAAAGIPVAVHFFFRSRYRTVPWAAMKFLHTSIEQTSRRLRFQELLLLLCRILVVALLAFALARPLSTLVRGAGGGDAVDAVLVFDVSMSMGASDGAMSRLQRAQAAALEIIEQLPTHSTVKIITCSDRADLLGPRNPGDMATARDLISQLEPTSLATDFYDGMIKAAEALKLGQNSNKELYLLSDMQKLGWEQQKGGLTRTLRDLREKAAVFLVRCGTRTPANVAIAGIIPQDKIPRPGVRSGFAVLVRNTGAEPVKDLKVSLSVDNDEKTAETQAVPRIDPGETRTIPLTGKLDRAGPRLLTARLSHDDLDGDNRFDQVLFVRETVNILLVDGAPNESEPEKASSFFLVNALQPVNDRSKYYLQPHVVPPRLASPALLAKQDLCILVNVALESDPITRAEAPPNDFIEELGQFVRRGHGLVIFAGDHVKPDAYNRILGKAGLLPLPVKAIIDRPFDEPLLFSRHSVALPAYQPLKESEAYKLFGLVPTWKAVALDEVAASESPSEDVTKNKQTRVAVRYSNGQPAVVLAKVDRGEVAFITTSANPGRKEGSGRPTWTMFSTKEFGRVYVPFLDMTLNHLLHAQADIDNVVAGVPLVWRPQEKELRTYTLIHPDGRKERLGLPEANDEHALVVANKLEKAGVYRMIAEVPGQSGFEDRVASRGDPPGVPIAVTPDPRETEDLSSLNNEEIDRLLGFTPMHITAGIDERQTGADRLDREWTTWLLMVLVFLTFAEALLAYWCGRAW